MFGYVNETPFDLCFSIGRIPVRVHPLFWVIGTFMGWNGSEMWAQALGSNPLAVVMVWLGCLFVSILVHELGHALVAQYYGWPPSILLYHFGGLAMYRPTTGNTHRRAIAIALAGPGAGFLLFGLVLVADQMLFRVSDESGRPLAQTLGLNSQIIKFAQYAFLQLQFINLFWGIINLIPVLPLDGGRVSENLWAILHPRTAFEGPTKLSIIASGLTAAFFLLKQPPNLYPGILFAYLAYINYQSIQQRRGNPW